MQFEQAAIKIQQEKEFQGLKAVIDWAFASPNLEKFLGSLRSRGIRVRDFESVLEKGIFGRIDRGSGSGERAKAMYGSLPVSDQAQIKEFYLFKVEEVAPELRAKFHKIYQYY